MCIHVGGIYYETREEMEREKIGSEEVVRDEKEANRTHVTWSKEGTPGVWRVQVGAKERKKKDGRGSVGNAIMKFMPLCPN